MSILSIPVDVLIVAFVITILLTLTVLVVLALASVFTMYVWDFVNQYSRNLKATNKHEAIYQFVPVDDLVHEIIEYDLYDLKSINSKEAMISNIADKVLSKWYDPNTGRMVIRFIDRNILRNMFQNAYREATMRDTKDNLRRCGLQISNRANRTFTLSPDTVIVEGLIKYENLVLGANYNIALQQAKRTPN